MADQEADLRGLPSLDELTAACAAPDWGGVLPHPVHSLSAIRPVIEQAFAGQSSTCPLGSRETLIVLVVDGLSFPVAERAWSPSRLAALTSTCPSTTSTALLSATTGRLPSEHGVLGVAFYDEAAGGMFNCYTDEAPDGFSLGELTTMFSALRERVDCVAHIGALATTPGRWCKAVVEGAEIAPPSVDWHAIANEPAAMVAAVVGELETTLRRRRSRPLLVWAHINLDSAIHLRGYGEAVCDAVKTLGRAAERWADSGHTVIAHSDHGLVEIADSARARRLAALLRGTETCRAESGGAGRLLWGYPRAGSALMEQCRDLAGDFAAIMHRDALLASGAVADTAAARRRIGEVVVVATRIEFPIFSRGHIFEHGGFSRDEMIAPIAIWAGG
ncbi:alkaline phosphatase family protein [Bradyrhizobium elkanii]|uniref:alkaline phosphatase family protein n=1 Tax=Bradyrhizobium elkanii TaxID=29448 RepID=UPI001BAAD7D8|nr:alkaline phosphatase family protein [Bradyrhizobium elkanii]MBR1158082.1 alkaline phosphatase family protein [Bradyrhizobium elkanii]